MHLNLILLQKTDTLIFKTENLRIDSVSIFLFPA